MNSLGPTLVILSVVLLLINWALRWKAERRFMREQRVKNREDSIKALQASWKRQDDQLDALAYSLQARKRELQTEQQAIAKIRAFANQIGISMADAEKHLRARGEISKGKMYYGKGGPYHTDKIKSGLDKADNITKVS